MILGVSIAWHFMALGNKQSLSRAGTLLSVLFLKSKLCSTLGDKEAADEFMLNY